MPSCRAGHGAAGSGGSMGGSVLLPALRGDAAAAGLSLETGLKLSWISALSLSINICALGVDYYAQSFVP